MPTSTKTISPLFDALGLPFSPEIGWETMTSVTTGAVKLTGEIAQEVATSVTGGGLNMKASFENFQRPHNPDPEEMKRKSDFENVMRFNNTVLEMKRYADASEQKVVAETQARLEIAGMDDEQFAKEAGYQNTGFRRFLRTLRNFMDVFKKRSEAIQKSKAENSPVNIRQGRLTELERFTQARFAAEQAGGQHVMSAVG